MRAKPSTCALLFALCQPLAAVAELPEAGMSMKAVEARFGQPLRKDAAVGSPPITRWEYSDSVVVFERSTVVHSMSVQRGSSPAQTGAAPAAKPVPAPVARPAPVPATLPAAPAAVATPAPAAPAPAASATTAHEAAEADAMSKAAAEKSAAGTAAPVEAIPGATPDTAAPANETYTFDPETGRIIVK